MRRFSFLFGALLFFSCQSLRQEVEPQQLADQPVKLIVACFIAPQDTVLAAKITRSRPILDDEPVNGLNITSATVMLENGTRSIVLKYDSDLQYYRADPEDFPIQAGKTYQLKIKTRDGRLLQAQTTVPDPARLQRAQLDSERVIENNEIKKRFFTRYYWTDLPNQSNYYQTNGVITYPCLTCSPIETVRQPVQFITGEGSQAIYTDEDSPNGPMTSAKGYMGASIPSDKHFFPVFFSRPFVLTASLLHVNNDYFRYHQALAQQLEIEDNPFAEPVPIPGNIQGGLGCFGAYNRSTVTVTLK
ncbi:uncharacterized protein DUF4249 [Larkinella arboricola]|uniref:Uncharacterized protein DUF4249 n=1 Tax=Larkinella arboricola TaxID=643671 RepID=A0A327X6Y7_LARAB|nr:DUF4249 domain-containing protein [Larkinella arboricola]RAK02501.1 uncharacterized protein DUF4249 [Larkinella arboricola]